MAWRPGPRRRNGVDDGVNFYRKFYFFSSSPACACIRSYGFPLNVCCVLTILMCSVCVCVFFYYFYDFELARLPRTANNKYIYPNKRQQQQKKVKTHKNRNKTTTISRTLCSNIQSKFYSRNEAGWISCDCVSLLSLSLWITCKMLVLCVCFVCVCVLWKNKKITSLEWKLLFEALGTWFISSHCFTGVFFCYGRSSLSLSLAGWLSLFRSIIIAVDVIDSIATFT